LGNTATGVVGRRSMSANSQLSGRPIRWGALDANVSRCNAGGRHAKQV
jgi:hypothetical protein